MLYLGHDVGLYPSLSVIDNIKFACTVHGVKVNENSILNTLNQPI